MRSYHKLQCWAMSMTLKMYTSNTNEKKQCNHRWHNATTNRQKDPHHQELKSTESQTTAANSPPNHKCTQTIGSSKYWLVAISSVGKQPNLLQTVTCWLRPTASHVVSIRHRRLSMQSSSRNNLCRRHGSHTLNDPLSSPLILPATSTCRHTIHNDSTSMTVMKSQSRLYI